MTGIKKIRRSLLFASIFLITSVMLSGCIGLETDPSGKDSGKINLFKKQVDNGKSNGSILNDTVPPSAISYLEAKRGINYLNWTWENPTDKDFDHIIIFIDGKFKSNVKKSLNYYNMTGLAAGKQYRIGVQTADRNKNINHEMVNATSATMPAEKDLIPPDKVWYLESNAGRTWINWTWENPDDKDFSYSNIIIDGKFAGNVTKPRNFINKTFQPGTSHSISIRTVDSKKNMNLNAVTDIAVTRP